jgi:hypothetical protein
MAGTRPLLRLLLLVAVALGVAGMHTLGHVSGEGHLSMGAGMPVATTSHATAADSMAPLDKPALATPHGLVVNLRWTHAGDGDGPGVPDGDPLSVCLAVLAALGMAVLVAAALRAVWSPSLLGSRAALITSPSRAPPPLRLGLRIADLSVLRT